MTLPPYCRRCGCPIAPRSGREVLPVRSHAARGLCWPCLRAVRKDGTLPDYERICRPREELLADYIVLRGEGHGLRQCAERLGMRYPAFERQLLRARAAGDVRAA